MSLTLSLYSALSGLQTNQAALQIISENVTNANTVGYTRKIAHAQTVTVDGGTAVRPEVIEVDFRSKETRGLRPEARRAAARPSRGLAIAWTVNGLAALLALLLAPGSLDQGAAPFFLLGALTGLAADGSARLLARRSSRRGGDKAAVNGELLAGAVIVCLCFSITLAIFGCVVVTIGLI